MNYSRITLAITAIIAAASLATVAFAVPQQVMAYRHQHPHNDNHKSIRVDQQVNQENQCSGQLPGRIAFASLMERAPSTVCVNEGNNSADIGH